MRALALTAALAAAAACAGDELAPSTQITAPRLLAVAAEPPVTTVDGAVALTALVVDGDGVPAAAPVAWRACNPWRVVRDPELDCAPAASSCRLPPVGARSASPHMRPWYSVSHEEPARSTRT